MFIVTEYAALKMDLRRRNHELVHEEQASCVIASFLGPTVHFYSSRS